MEESKPPRFFWLQCDKIFMNDIDSFWIIEPDEEGRCMERKISSDEYYDIIKKYNNERRTQ